MIKFLRDLAKANLGSKNDADIYFLNKCIHALVTKDKSQLKTAFSLLLHGLTKKKDFVSIASDLGIANPYHNALYLHECCALDESERLAVGPAEIAERRAGTVIIDNDDFNDDDLNGGTDSYRTNTMLVQPKK